MFLSLVAAGIRTRTLHILVVTKLHTNTAAANLGVQHLPSRPHNLTEILGTHSEGEDQPWELSSDLHQCHDMSFHLCLCLIGVAQASPELLILPQPSEPCG